MTMDGSKMDRTQAWGLLCEYTQSESLRKHMLAVEACMRAYARKFGQDENHWGITGLLHDFDYEKYPTPAEHPFVGNKILEERGYPEDVRRAILSHADYSGVKRESQMEKALYACDEVSGLYHRVRAGQAEQVTGGSGSQVRAQENEGQSLCPQREPG